MSIMTGGVQIDESELKENQKPDPFDAAWSQYAGGVDDLHDVKEAPKEKRDLDTMLSEQLDRALSGRRRRRGDAEGDRIP